MHVRVPTRVCIMMRAARFSRVQGMTVMPATLRGVAVQMRVIVIVRRRIQATTFAKSNGNAQLKSTERPRPCLRQDEQGDEDAGGERVHRRAYRRVGYYTLNR